MKEQNKRGKNIRQQSKKEFIFLTAFLIAVLVFTFLIYISITARIVEEIQPDAVSGQDTYITNGEEDDNFGSSTSLYVGKTKGDYYNILIQFNISSIPANATINSVTLKLYQYSTTAKGGVTRTIYVYPLTRAWDEGNSSEDSGATWEDATNTTAWTTYGGDFNSSISSSTVLNATNDIWREWDITEAFKAWHNGSMPNYGIIIQHSNSDKRFSFYSSDYGTSSLRPKLVVDYSYAVNDTIAPNVTLNSPTDDANLTSSTVVFSCSATDNVQLSNITLYGNWSGGWHANETKSVSGTSNTTSFTKTITDGNYKWNCYACDNSSNCNFALADRTFTIDTTPPGTVTGLGETAASQTWIYWTWTNPADPDFSHVEIWLDGTFKINTTNNYYNATGLLPNTWHTIATRTVDDFGNINTNWVNDSAKTQAPIDNPPITNLIAPSDSSTDNDGNISFICNATDDLQLSNMAFYWNYSGTWQQNGTQTISGVTNQTTFIRTGLDNGVILWNCKACDNASQCDFADANWTVIVNTSAPCIEDWTVQYGSCLTNDSQLKYYIDGNSCGTYDDLPIDNGTYVSCNYCSENITGPYNTSCNTSDQLTQYWIDENYATCCAITGLASDCHINNGSYDNQTLGCIYEEPSDGGGGGGGGRRPVEEPTIAPKAEVCDITIPLRENMKGTCADLDQGESIYFELDGITHSIMVNEITANNVEIVMYYSLPHKATLAVSQIEEIDLDDDGINDISVKLDKIQEDKATITVTVIMEFKPMALGVCDCPECSAWSACIEGKQSRTCYECSPETDFACIVQKEEQDCIIKPYKFPWLWVLFSALWASLGVLIYLAYMHRKKRKKK